MMNKKEAMGLAKKHSGAPTSAQEQNVMAKKLASEANRRAKKDIGASDYILRKNRKEGKVK